MTTADTLTRAAQLLKHHADELVRSYRAAHGWSMDAESQAARRESEEMTALAARLREMADHISEQDSKIDRLNQAVRLAESCIPGMPTIQSDPVGSMQKVRDRMLRLEAELSELKPLPPGSMTLGTGQREAWAEVRRLRQRIAELERRCDRLLKLLQLWMDHWNSAETFTKMKNDTAEALKENDDV